MSTTAVLSVLELVGVLLVSYGVIRESFSDLSRERPFGEGAFGEGTFGGGSSRIERFLLGVGGLAKLLPRGTDLTLTDRKKHAACAVLGVLLVVTSLLIGLLEQLLL